MAKVKVSNTREHVINMTIGKENAIIPASRQNPEDRSEIIHGHAFLEDSFVEAAKRHPVASHYFKEGWLRDHKESGKQKSE